MDVMQIIKSHEKDFSKTELKVFNYIIQNSEVIETYTISKVARLSNTSTSAVLRFCQTLGFHGYKDFRFEIIQYLRQQQHTINPADYYQNLCQQYNNTINQLNNIDRELLNQLIDDIKNKPRIYITGIHYSSLPAKSLMFGLQDLGILSYYASDAQEIIHLLNTVKDDDLLINFSLSGVAYSYLSIDKSANLPVSSYLITENPNQKQKSFKNTLVLPGHDIARQSIVDIQSIPMMFVEILLNLLHNSF